MPDDEPEWDTVLDRGDLRGEIVVERDRLADAAREGDWARVFALLDEAGNSWHGAIDVNSVRVGGTSGFAPLHQAAWHGEDLGTARNLLDRGAWRSLRTKSGETAEDIARRRGHLRLADLVSAPVTGGARLADIETYLTALITVRTRGLGKSLRMPQLGPLEENPSYEFWCPVAGMYGGFAYRWLDPDDRSVLDVTSWSRVVGGSGQRHHIMANGVTLVEKGFV